MAQVMHLTQALKGTSFKVSFLLPGNMLLTSWEELTDDGQQLSYEPEAPILTIHICYEYMYGPDPNDTHLLWIYVQMHMYSRIFPTQDDL